METFAPEDILIKLNDGTRWVFMFYDSQIVHLDLAILEAQTHTVVVKPFGEGQNDDLVQTLPAAEFKKAPQETFTYGDIIIHAGEGSKWKFKRYIDGMITVGADWADENKWTGSSGDKTQLYAIRFDDNADSEIGVEQRFPSRLFGKV